MSLSQCTECHTVDLRSITGRAPDDPRYIRSPGFTMTYSRCYNESGGRLSCLTCHNPHRDAERAVSFYETRCRTCHVSERTDPIPVFSASQGRACPVNPATGCLDCHMPKVPIAELHTTLTDHYIRVRHAQETKK